MNELKLCPFCGGEATQWDNSIWEPVIDEGGAYAEFNLVDTGVCETAWI